MGEFDPRSPLNSDSRGISALNLIPIFHVHSPKNNATNETTYPPEIAKVFALTSFSALSLLTISPAQAVVLDFESLAQNNAILNLPSTINGASYTEKGFTVTPNNSTSLYSWGTQSSDYAGSTTLFNFNVGGNTRLTRSGVGAFNLSSIDLTNLFSGGQSVSVLFTGTKSNNTTVTQSFTTDAVLTTLETFNFTNNFTDLVSVDWNQTPPFHQFDNINVSAVTATAVPEPLTIIGTLFGTGSSILLKRKLSKSRQNID